MIAADHPLVALTLCFRNRTLPWSEAAAIAAHAPAITHVYAPLTYAWAPHEAYLRRYGSGRKRVLFVGMNPGPFGMVQTGIPFGDVPSVRDWLGIIAPVEAPPRQDPKKPVRGFSCPRREVSGVRLWGMFAKRFGTPQRFFADHFVLNYCPLAFLAHGRNVTPDKLPAAVREPLLTQCDAYLRAVVSLLQPEWVVGIGQWATKRVAQALARTAGKEAAIVLPEKGDRPDRPAQTIPTPKVVTMLHPSPASPAANRGWAAQAVAQLEAAGVW